MENNRLINIVHISDMHFGSQNFVYSTSELQNGINRVIDDIKDENLFLLLSGDITYQGTVKGFEEAKPFFDQIIRTNNLRRENILLCPGNHDKVRIEKIDFEYFQGFSYFIRRDKIFTYIDKNCDYLETDSLFLLGINSSFKLDHRFGIADISSIDKILQKTASSSDLKIKIAFLHHHLINQFEGDLSVLRNAYDLLVLLDEHKFKYIFHGHQHSNQFLPIGKSGMCIFGVRTFNFDTKGYPNGFNHYEISLNSIIVNNYIYLKDSETRGIKGRFQKVFSRKLS
ncbi:metallophosphoesterase family protein [Nostoc sp.]|uniref:metallophosphoesterase family protein n=1 Tax=Nostoc sp. TaxID=1180 RepID=UPI002FF9C24A